ncbi:VOC family protein [Buchananella hordeovulneris]|uniref:Glyoxalase n=1 Tax=Buchananella hordeovulneris TaxID=52770 RepID=A0A1Q5PXY7_9ACTO|nr:VOC family protein [Buchananella hordeovulneris]OKL52397.1 glyoxalase [Buchananella hordeovulneris]RRD45414.1 VOC family protein [Buchananella hordeovulneris]
MHNNDAPQVGISGKHTTRGIPHGWTSLTPFLALPQAGAAVDFYQRAFGARVVTVTEIQGSVVHAELDFGVGRLQLGQPNPTYQLVARPDGEEDCYSLSLYCADVDDTVARALAAGATLREPASTFVSGDRYASLRDPFGVRWSVMSRVEDLSEAESVRRVSEWAARQDQTNSAD